MPSDRQADEIRSRLLFKLGIYDTKFINSSISQKIRAHKQVNPVRLRRNSLQDDIDIALIRYVEPLKFADEMRHSSEQLEESLTVSCSSSSSSSSDAIEEADNGPLLSTSIPEPPSSLLSTTLIIGHNTATTLMKRVHFNHAVSVIPIPSHTSFSPCTRSLLFIGKKEMVRNAERNTREFIYENFDWRCAVEEDQMVSKDLVRPANRVRSSFSGR